MDSNASFVSRFQTYFAAATLSPPRLKSSGFSISLVAFLLIIFHWMDVCCDPR